jgi:protein TonB
VPDAEPPPVTSTAEIAPVAPPIKKPVKKVVPKPHHELAPVLPEPSVEESLPATVAAAPSDAPVHSAEPAGPPPSYLASLRQKLERNKVYPRAARQRRQEGTAILRCVIDRDGHVLSRRVEKSTGYADLDREVEAMLERAQPLPPMPAEMTQAQLEIAVPVDFHLR